MFSDFRVLDFWPFFSCSVFGFVRPRKIIRQISATLSGLPKNRGKQGFMWSCAAFFFNFICYMLFPFLPCGLLMLVFPFMYLHRCKCLIRRCCLTCSFCFLFVFRCVFLDLFALITSMVLYQWPKNKIKPQKTPISEILFLMFCFGACTLTLSPGPHNNRNPKPSTPEIVFVYFLMFLIMCWNAYFYSAFRTSTKFALKIGP